MAEGAGGWLPGLSQLVVRARPLKESSFHDFNMPHWDRNARSKDAADPLREPVLGDWGLAEGGITSEAELRREVTFEADDEIEGEGFGAAGSAYTQVWLLRTQGPQIGFSSLHLRCRLRQVMQPVRVRSPRPRGFLSLVRGGFLRGASGDCVMASAFVGVFC